MSVDTALEELTTDQLGPATDAGDSESQTPTDTGEPDGATNTTAEGNAETPPATPPAAPEPTFTYGGRKYTESQLRALPVEQLNALIQSAEQLPALTKKHQQTLEQLAAKALEAPAQPAQPAPAQPRITADQITASYKQAVTEAVKDGYVEEDFATLYPNATANLMFFRDVIYKIADSNKQAWDALNGIHAEISGGRESSAKQEALRSLDNTMASLAGEGGIFEPLLNQESRNALFEYAKSLNLQYGTFKDPETMKSLWIAMNRNTILGSAPAPAPAPRPRTPATARGEAQGARPTPAAPIETTPLDELINDFLPKSARR